ncbi:cobaltochelatase subunit CobN [Sphingopyxis sp. MWB1]|uniref:cobaltochelatase subunit CobN n=1 Tax=Sphingopyxis sp. MWB1 TaxID=1537715 RepID=UPI00051A2FDA|nr:cobaltochelatase subunit CobN [Sphingopyxis sp. MWB1]
MLRLLLLFGLLLCPSWLAAQQGPDQPLVRVVTTPFVLPAKFQPMQAWARDAGYRLEWVQVGEGDEGPADLAEGADFLILDGPRPSDMAAAQQAVGALDSLSAPWLSIGGGPPRFGHLPPAVARRLIAYYAGGGADNLKAFVAALPRALAGESLDHLPPPQSMPETGYYHPLAPQLFTAPEEIARWQAEMGWHARPVVAFAISSGAIRDMQTEVVEALAESAAAHGLMPIFFWHDDRDPEGITRMIRPLAAHALVNLTHMQNGDARKAEFEALDIPVLQGLNDRSNRPAQWRESVSGVGGTSTAVMLTGPEAWGVSDPIVLSAVEDGAPVPLAEQVELLSAKLARLVALRKTPAASKRLALFFWNYPHGEKNLAASNLNLPLSLEKLTQDLAAAGYDVAPEESDTLITSGQAMLGGLYRPETLQDLLDRDLAARLPLATYKAWIDTLPAARREELLAALGPPENSPALIGEDFIIPRLALGKLAILPQPPRGRDPRGAYHDKVTPPDHRYLATYLWAREGQRADAIIHMGTHGTQEWTPGKDRGLWAGDYPFLLVGDVPVFYPYIQDNVAEAIQARRRGRAVTISHQTPAFAPSGLYDELRDIHALIHQYAQLEAGTVRDRVAEAIVRQADSARLDADMGWDEAAITRDFPGYYQALHDHLHQLARMSIPLGLHVFGAPASPDRRLTTVMQQLGPDYLNVLGLDPQEAFAEGVDEIRQSEAYRTLAYYLREGGDIAAIADPALREQIELAASYERNLADPGESEALLVGLAGGFVHAGAGGDPIRNPQVRSGRNLYAFEAEKVPARAAYEEGGRALDQMIEAHVAKHGTMPRKIAFSVFAGETIRTLGIGEGQMLHALGLRPVWDRGGRVERLDIVPLEELGRPRIDVVMQPSSVYRDQFDRFLRLLADGIDRLANLEEESGPAAGAREIEQALIARGVEPERARDLSRLRIFTNAPGDYVTGLPDALTPGDDGRPAGWEDDGALADPFLQRMQYAYGARDWGVKLEGTNLFAEQLRDVDAAVMSRSSNLHGLLSTDHPFEHLGGLSLAVRHLTVRSPALYVTDMRGGEVRMTTAASFLSDELRVRYLNPQWIGEMQKEGYAGANAILGIVNNLWGWQVVDPGSVRADQWQAMHDTYVRDARRMGLNRFFERVHPDAQMQMIARMQEAIARGYWQADEATRQSLAGRLRELQDRGAALDDPISDTAGPRGVGLNGVMAARAAAPSPPAFAAQRAALPAPAPTGRILERVVIPDPPQQAGLRNQLSATLVLALLFLFGVLLEARSRRSSRPWETTNARA